MSITEQLLLRPLWLLGELGMGNAIARAGLTRLDRYREANKATMFADYQPGTHDVIVATYAKSGTNWMLQIVSQLAWHGQAEFDHIHDICPWPDGFADQGDAQLTDPQPSSPTGLRAIKTHLEQPDIPMHPDAKYIVVVRDPKDAFVSGYHFAHGVIRTLINARFTPDEWLQMFLSGRPYLFDNWAAFTASWWAVRDQPNVLWISFDELKSDLPGSVQRVAHHIGVELSESALSQVIERSGFAWMKAHDAQFAPVLPQMRSESAVMIRSGKSGESLLSPEQRETLDNHCRQQLKDLGSDLPYDELFSA